MEVRIEAGDGVDLSDMQRPRIGYCLKLVRRQVSVLALNRLEILKNAVRIVRSWVRLGQ